MVQNGKAYKKFEDYLYKATKDATSILDIGTSQRFAKELKPYEEYLSAKGYKAYGYEPQNTFGEYNCDGHQDIENLSFDDNSFDSVICLEVLEHVKNPFQAVKEIKRVLKPNGKLFLSVPFLTQYHGKGSLSQSHDSYPDFYRFTHEGLGYLFEDFANVEISPIDGAIEFRLKQFYMQKLLDKSKLFRKFIDFIDNPRLGKATTRHILYGAK